MQFIINVFVVVVRLFTYTFIAHLIIHSAVHNVHNVIRPMHHIIPIKCKSNHGLTEAYAQHATGLR